MNTRTRESIVVDATNFLFSIQNQTISIYINTNSVIYVVMETISIYINTQLQLGYIYPGNSKLCYKLIQRPPVVYQYYQHPKHFAGFKNQLPDKRILKICHTCILPAFSILVCILFGYASLLFTLHLSEESISFSYFLSKKNSFCSFLALNLNPFHFSIHKHHFI